MVGIISVKI